MTTTSTSTSTSSTGPTGSTGPISSTGPTGNMGPLGQHEPEPDSTRTWTPVCRYDELEPERGVAALVGSTQLAVFRLHGGAVHVVDHHDPASGANVIARGIIGTRGQTPTVASPMYKQVFDLHTGQCLDDPRWRLRRFAARVVCGSIEVLVEHGEPVPAPARDDQPPPADGPGPSERAG